MQMSINRAMKRLRKRSLFLAQKIVELSAVAGGQCDWEYTELKAIETSLICMELLKSYGFVSITNTSGALFSDQLLNEWDGTEGAERYKEWYDRYRREKREAEKANGVASNGSGCNDSVSPESLPGDPHEDEEQD